MTVTHQRYTLAPGHTGADIMNAWQQAFKDAGVLPSTGWYDSWTATNNHLERVVERVYDANKRYGTSYFRFSWIWDSFIGYDRYNGVTWNTSSHSPVAKTGETIITDYNWWTSGKDRYSNNSVTYNTYFRGFTVNSDSLSTTWDKALEVNIDRFTSGVNPDVTFFRVTGANVSEMCFMFMPKNANIISSIADLNEYSVPELWHVYLNKQYNANVFSLYTRDIAKTDKRGSGARLWTSYYRHSNDQHCLCSYNVDDDSNSGGVGQNQVQSPYFQSVQLPVKMKSHWTDEPSNITPIFTEFPMCYFTSDLMPSDFGIATWTDNLSANRDDILEVTAGVEEWRIVDVPRSRETTSGSNIELYLVARMV